MSSATGVKYAAPADVPGTSTSTFSASSGPCSMTRTRSYSAGPGPSTSMVSTRTGGPVGLRAAVVPRAPGRTAVAAAVPRRTLRRRGRSPHPGQPAVARSFASCCRPPAREKRYTCVPQRGGGSRVNGPGARWPARTTRSPAHRRRRCAPGAATADRRSAPTTGRQAGRGRRPAGSDPRRRPPARRSTIGARRSWTNCCVQRRDHRVTLPRHQQRRQRPPHRRRLHDVTHTHEEPDQVLGEIVGVRHPVRRRHPRPRLGDQLRRARPMPVERRARHPGLPADPTERHAPEALGPQQPVHRIEDLGHRALDTSVPPVGDRHRRHRTSAHRAE